jgi:predicted short-subunit dehydrogenase-like oxidoreductase (DUF2520 family)
MLTALDPSARFKIAVIGAGRVARHLVPALAAAGHRITGIWSRDPAQALALASCLPAGTSLLSSPAEAARLQPDLVLVAVPDHAIPAIIALAALPADVVVAHTAGTLPLPAHPRAGVLYPLQTFSVDRVLDLGAVPFFLEATDPATAAMLENLVHTISRRPPTWLTAAQRAPLHLAAVFASNFPNHLLGVSAQILARAENAELLPFALLRPLVEEVIAKAFAAPNGPFSVQTGPAARHDDATIAAHRTRLSADPVLAPWLPTYDNLTKAIQRLQPQTPADTSE